MVYQTAIKDCYLNDEYFNYEGFGEKIKRDRKMDDFAFIGEPFDKNNNQLTNQIDNQIINTSIENYNYFNGMDSSSKNNLVDEYKNNIILYSKNLNNCIQLCNSLENCNGFSKFENSCILKKNFSSNSIYYSPKINLYIKK